MSLIEEMLVMEILDIIGTHYTTQGGVTSECTPVIESVSSLRSLVKIAIPDA